MELLAGDSQEVIPAPEDDLVEVPPAAPTTTLHASSKMNTFDRGHDGVRGRDRDPVHTRRLSGGLLHIPAPGLLQGSRKESH